MKRLIVLVLVLSPLPALADDASYCAAMSDLALRYLGKFSHGRAVYDLSVTVPVDQCARGDYARGIPALERKLLDNRFTLPER